MTQFNLVKGILIEKGIILKIQLPDGREKNLDENISLEEKVKVVEELSEEFLSTIQRNWNSNSVKFFLDSLANYMVWHKESEEKGLEDKEIMSRKKMEKLIRMKKTSKSLPFSSLTTLQKESIGLDGANNE